MSRDWRTWALRLIPIVACVGLSLHGLGSWFQLDDFFWLNLWRVARVDGWWQVLNITTNQGSWRPLSEHAVFMGLGWLFQSNDSALPFRLLVLVTQLADVWLIGSLSLRLWRRSSAAWLAPLLWTVHGALAMPMVWTSAYNQILCTLVLAGAVRLFALFIDTGRRRWYGLAAVTFLLGLLVLETAVVFPALAACWLLATAPRVEWRRRLIGLGPLFAVSLLFVLNRLRHQSAATPGAYQAHFDGRLLATLWQYWRWSLLPPHWLDEHAVWTQLLVVAVFSLVLAAWVARRAQAGDRRPLFGLAWYLLTVGPVLPLSEHLTDYYLVVPVVGLSLLLAGLTDAAWQRGVAPRVVAASLTALYVWAMAASNDHLTGLLSIRTHGERAAMRALVAVRRDDWSHILLLDEVDGEAYRLALGHRALLALGLDNVYLTPEGAARIAGGDFADPPASLSAPPEMVRAWLASGAALVLDLYATGAIDVTREYAAGRAAKP